VLTDDQVGHAIPMARGTSTTWIEHLLLTGMVDDAEIAKRVGAYVAVPSCVLARLVAAPRDALQLLPMDMAVEHRAVPVWVEPDGDVCVAMVDPTDERALNELTFFTGRRVLREVARATGIAWALHAHYGADTALWEGTDQVDRTTAHLRRVFGGSSSRPVAASRR